MNLAFVILGAIATLAGLVVLIAGVRGGAGESPRAAVQLIGGMMLAAFGLLLAGFAIVYDTADPIEATP